MDTKTEKKINGIIQRHMNLFRKPGVLTVRPGTKITGGWITDKPSIVVTVDKKLDGLDNKSKLPAEVEDVPTDVREATGMQRLRHADQASFGLAIKHSRSEDNEPNWPKERNVQTGALVNKQASNQSKAGVKSIKKQEINYTPASVPLSSVDANITITAYATPDAQVTVLEDFLNGTQGDLTIAMYDFTSGELLDTVVQKLKPGKINFEMVLDHPPRNPTANQTDDVTRSNILQASKKAAVNWALTRNDPAATEWIYPSAYHIKVAVRDGIAFWLSSGNFNVSNQPDFAAGNTGSGNPSTSDRDWHVIVEHVQLAKMFKAYIDHDFTVAAGGQSAGDANTHAAIVAAMAKLKAAKDQSSLSKVVKTSSHPFTLGLKKIFNNAPVKIQPLLTPDKGVHSTMYVDQVLALINSAEQKVYMQTQYIHPVTDGSVPDFMLLVNALVAAQKKGRDVRLITSEFENTPQWVEIMQTFGLDKSLRIQQHVHNKGIVIDSKVVMVSSQNWSSAGVLQNRDAGLIIDNPQIAAYFEAIFIEDWTLRAAQKLVDVSHMVSKTKSGTKQTAPPAKGAKKKKANPKKKTTPKKARKKSKAGK